MSRPGGILGQNSNLPIKVPSWWPERLQIDYADVKAFVVLFISGIIFLFALLSRYPELSVLWSADLSSAEGASLKLTQTKQRDSAAPQPPLAIPSDRLSSLTVSVEEGLRQKMIRLKKRALGVSVINTQATEVKLNGITISRTLAPLMCSEESRLTFPEFLDAYRKVCTVTPRLRTQKLPQWMDSQNVIDKTIKPDVVISP